MKKPNIVCIVLDHVTFHHYKLLNGAKPILRTYEQLAREGVEFTCARSSHPLCLPCRASMMTGVQTHKHKHYKGDSPHENTPYPLYSSYFKGTDYKLGFFGKNHSGYDLDSSVVEGFYPKGYGNPYKSKEYREYLDKNGYENPIYHQEWGMLFDYRNDNFDLTVTNNFNTYSAGYLDNRPELHEASFLISMAQDFIERNKDNPYVLHLNIWGPHQAYMPPKEYADTIRPQDIESYPTFYGDTESRPEFVSKYLDIIHRRNGSVANLAAGKAPAPNWERYSKILARAFEHYTFIDDAVGKFIASIPDRDNTIIIYTADHGDSMGAHGGMVDKAGDFMEEVMDIPLVISGPGIPKNAPCDAFTSNIDFLPTILDAAGIPVPDYMDGISLIPLAQGDISKKREVFMAEHYGHFDVSSRQRALYYKNFKLTVAENYRSELYDIENDPFEMNNLYNDTAYSDIVAVMTNKLQSSDKE